MPRTHQEETDKALDTINRGLEEKQIIEVAKQRGMSYVDVESLNLNPDLCDIISEKDANEGVMIPFFKAGKKVRVAVADPDLPKTKEVLQKLRIDQYLLNVCLASKNGIVSALRLYDSRPKDESEDFITELDEVNLSEYDKEIDTLFDELKNKMDTLKSAELLNILLVGAIKTRASDIHLEPQKTHLEVRYRIDGMLQKVFEIPVNKIDDLIKQTKHQAKLKLNVTARPQDGRFYFVINEREVDVRVSALPTPLGEDIVLRILDSQNKNITFDNLGLEDITKDLLLDAIKRPYGMILTTGPTGSGKTTSLYALLKTLSKPESKVITLEDPIEYKLESITQSQISEAEDYTFANGLRSILRQDPDVVMVGEIRDLDTAQAAAQAALTGHKVLSTLHTNDAIGAIDRLINMGLERFMVAPSIDTVIAQRLARKCCEHCVEEKKLTGEEKTLFIKVIDRLNEVLNKKVSLPETVKVAKGCDKCSQTGYQGRIGLYEIVCFNDEIKQMILDKKSASKIRELARAHSCSIFEAGILKVIKGETTIEEIIRISKSGE